MKKESEKVGLNLTIQKTKIMACDPITSWQIDGETMETVKGFIYLFILLVGCSPWGREESDMTERLHFHFPLSCIGEGNGNPLQCSCLENPRDGGAWWAVVHGVAEGRTQLSD